MVSLLFINHSKSLGKIGRVASDFVLGLKLAP